MKNVDWDIDTIVKSCEVHTRTKSVIECDICHKPINIGEDYVTWLAINSYSGPMMMDRQHVRCSGDDLNWWLFRFSKRRRRVSDRTLAQNTHR